MATHRRPDGRTLGLLGLAVTLLFTFAATAQQMERFDERVWDFFFAGYDGIADAFWRGMTIVEDTLEDDPDHPQALAW